MTTNPDDAMIIQAPTMTAAGAALPAAEDRPPEVRQCQDPDDPMFGAVAVAGTEGAAGLWGIMHPSRGGHWAVTDNRASMYYVGDWTVLS